MALVTDIASALAEELAEDLGIKIPSSELAKYASSLVTVEALKSCADLVWPAVAQGITFSAVGLTLAVIRKKLKDVEKQLNLLLDKDKKVATDKFHQAVISIENGNYHAANVNFEKALDKATEGYYLCRDNLARLYCGKLRLLAVIMTKCYDPELNIFLPYFKIGHRLKKELAQTVKYILDELLAEVEANRRNELRLTDAMLLRQKDKSRQLKATISDILKVTYPVLSVGMQWTCPCEVIEEESDVLALKIYPEYVPFYKENTVKLVIGTGNESKLRYMLSLYREKRGKLHVDVRTEQVDTEMTANFSTVFMLNKLLCPNTSRKSSKMNRESQKVSLTVLPPEEPSQEDKNVFNIEGSSSEDSEGVLTCSIFGLEVFKGRCAIFKDCSLLVISAARNCKSQIVSSVLKDCSAASINAQNKDGKSPLSMAATYGYPYLLQWLLDRPEIQANIADKDGNTALHLAVKYNQYKAIAVFVTRLENLDTLNDEKMTPLHLACRTGDLKAVQLLIESGANFPTSAQDFLRGSEQTPLFVASQHNSLEVARYLIQSGSNPFHSGRILDGATPFWMACKAGNSNMVKFMLSGKFATTSETNLSFEGLSAGQVAQGHPDVVKILRGKGIS